MVILKRLAFSLVSAVAWGLLIDFCGYLAAKRYRKRRPHSAIELLDAAL